MWLSFINLVEIIHDLWYLGELTTATETSAVRQRPAAIHP
jgi:hypothetical protein